MPKPEDPRGSASSSSPISDIVTPGTPVGGEPSCVVSIQTPDISRDDGGHPTSQIIDVPESCWRVGFKEFRSAYTHTTEASDNFLFASALTAISVLIGRFAHVRQSMKIFPNFYSITVGVSGRSRKTASKDCIRTIIHEVNPEQAIVYGIGSGEGLVESMAKVPMSNMLLDVGEVAILLKKAKQENNILIPVLTNIYDCPESFSIPNRKNTSVTRPFLSLSTTTTLDWYRSELEINDVMGGFSGRFGHFMGYPKPPIPWPPAPDHVYLNECIRIIKNAISKITKDPREYKISPGALEIWSKWYIEEQGREYASILQTVAARLHTNAVKLALVFAVVEQTEVITEEQIQAAIDFSAYQRTIQEIIFLNIADSKILRRERAICKAFFRHGAMTKSECHRKLGGNITAQDFHQTFGFLTAVGRLVLIPDHETINLQAQKIVANKLKYQLDSAIYEEMKGSMLVN